MGKRKTIEVVPLFEIEDPKNNETEKKNEHSSISTQHNKPVTSLSRRFSMYTEVSEENGVNRSKTERDIKESNGSKQGLSESGKNAESVDRHGKEGRKRFARKSGNTEELAVDPLKPASKRAGVPKEDKRVASKGGNVNVGPETDKNGSRKAEKGVECGKKKEAVPEPIEEIPSIVLGESRMFHAPISCPGKPRVIDAFNLEIIVNGQPRRVSSWSIKDGVYYEGLDSNYIVKGKVVK